MINSPSLQLFVPPTPETPVPRPLWLTTFADLMALLVTFFVLLFSVSSINPVAWQSLGGVKANESALSDAGVLPQSLMDSRESAELDLGYLAAVLAQHVGRDRKSADLSALQADISIADGTLMVLVPTEALFELPSTRFTEAGRKYVAAVAGVLAYSGNKVYVRSIVGDHGERNRWLPGLEQARALSAALARQGNLASVDVEISGTQGGSDYTSIIIEGPAGREYLR